MIREETSADRVVARHNAARDEAEAAQRTRNELDLAGGILRGGAGFFKRVRECGLQRKAIADKTVLLVWDVAEELSRGSAEWSGASALDVARKRAPELESVLTEAASRGADADAKAIAAKAIHDAERQSDKARSRPAIRDVEFAREFLECNAPDEARRCLVSAIATIGGNPDGSRERFLVGCILTTGAEAFGLLKKCGVGVGMLRDPLAVRVWREAERQEGEHPGKWEGGNVLLAVTEKAPEAEAELLSAMSAATSPAYLESEAREIVAADARRRGVGLADDLSARLKAGLNPREALGALVDLYNGGTLAGEAAKAKPFKTAVRFGDFMAQDIEVPPPIVEGFLLRQEVTLLSAEAKLGKTWFLLQLAECVAAGIPFLGWRTEQGAVLYLNMEVGAAMMQQRARMVAERLGVEDPPVYFVNALDEPKPPNIQNLEARVKATVAALEAKDGRQKFALIVADPFYCLANGIDENSASEVAGACMAFKRLAHDVNAAVVCAHHCAKGDPSGRRVNDRSRGSSAFSGAVDNPLSLTLKSQDADGKVAQLAGNWRNLPPLPPHDLRWNVDVGLWEDLGEAEPMEPQGGARGRPALYTIEGLVEMFADAPDGFMRRQDFIDKGVGKNAITPLLNRAVEAGRIVRTRSSSGDVYRLAEEGDGQA